MDRDAVILRVDPENLPANLDDIQHALRPFHRRSRALTTARRAALGIVRARGIRFAIAP